MQDGGAQVPEEFAAAGRDELIGGCHRLRSAWHRTWGTVTALLGIALLLVSGIARASVPSFLDDERAFRSTPPCPAGSPTDSWNGVAQTTNDTPVGEPQFVTAFAPAVLSVGLFALHAGGTASFRARRHAVRGLPGSLVRRGKQAFAATLCVIPAGMVGEVAGPIWVVVSWAVLSGLAWFLVERLEAGRGGRHAQVRG